MFRTVGALYVRLILLASVTCTVTNLRIAYSVVQQFCLIVQSVAYTSVCGRTAKCAAM